MRKKRMSDDRKFWVVNKDGENYGTFTIHRANNATSAIRFVSDDIKIVIDGKRFLGEVDIEEDLTHS